MADEAKSQGVGVPDPTCAYVPVSDNLIVLGWEVESCLR